MTPTSPSFGSAAPCITIALAASLLLAGCSGPSRDDEPPLARVDGKTITLSDLKQTSNLNYLSVGEAAERWIDQQVLLNFARTSDLVDHRALEDRLRDHQTQLLTTLLLDSLLLSMVNIDPERVREYYANNLREFSFPDDAALIVHIGFVHSEDARDAVRRLRVETQRDSLLSQFNFDRQLIIRHRLIPALDQAISAAELDQLVGPIVSDFGYHLFWVERRFRKAETVPFAYVRREIYQRLFQLQRPLARSFILDSLRETLNVEVYLD